MLKKKMANLTANFTAKSCNRLLALEKKLNEYVNEKPFDCILIGDSFVKDVTDFEWAKSYFMELAERYELIGDEADEEKMDRVFLEFCVGHPLKKMAFATDNQALIQNFRKAHCTVYTSADMEKIYAVEEFKAMSKVKAAKASMKATVAVASAKKKKDNLCNAANITKDIFDKEFIEECKKANDVDALTEHFFDNTEELLKALESLGCSKITSELKKNGDYDKLFGEESKAKFAEEIKKAFAEKSEEHGIIPGPQIEDTDEDDKTDDTHSEAEDNAKVINEHTAKIFAQRREQREKDFFEKFLPNATPQEIMKIPNISGYMSLQISEQMKKDSSKIQSFEDLQKNILGIGTTKIENLKVYVHSRDW